MYVCMMIYMQFLLKNNIFQLKTDSIRVILKVKKILKQHRAICRDLYSYKKIKK